MPKKNYAPKVLEISFWFFYAATVFLWFKNSIFQLKTIPINYVVPFGGLCCTGLVILFLFFRTKKLSLRFRFNKSTFWLILIIILALGLRLPYLIYHTGLSDSDDAITILMSKHISEGKTPPLYFYRQLYQGSLFSHLSALMIIIFGFSHLLIELIIIFLYLVFIAVQFHLFKKLFSLTFAVLASAFYCLPIVQVLKCSFFISSAYPLVLLLGSTILFLSYQISFGEKTERIRWLGFLMGLAFWTHQGTLGFVLTAIFILFLKFRSQWKKYLSLCAYMVLGGLPLLMAEVFLHFPLIRSLIPGQAESPDQTGYILKNTINFVISLFSLSPNIIGYVVLFLVLLGLMALIFPSLHSKRFHPQSLFSLFFLLFMAIYLISDFSQTTITRYLYPLYFSLPVLLLGSFWMIRHKIRYYMMVIIIVALPFGLNWKDISDDLQSVKNDHRTRTRTVMAMKKTGKRFWRGNFWSAYLITALSGEELIVDSYSVNRYFPYRLAYDNQSETENFIFITGKIRDEKRMADRFTELLEVCQVDYQEQDLGDFRLVHGIKSPVPPMSLITPVPAGLPLLDISWINYEGGFLEANFTNIGDKADGGIWIQAEIPGYSAVRRRFPAGGGQVDIQLPYPHQASFPLEFYLSYKGINLPHTQRNAICTPPEGKFQERKSRIFFLSRIEPKIEIEGRKMMACDKDMKIEVNGPLDNTTKVRLYLYSPFEFSDFVWYGDYFQELEIFLNDTPLQKSTLNDGYNIIQISLKDQLAKETSNIISLHFKYHLFFNFAPFHRIAALLEKVELE